MRVKNLLLICTLFPALNLLAVQDPLPQLSTAGIGDAKFGTTPEAVTRAFGRKLIFAKGTTKADIKNGCAIASIDGLPGFDLLFKQGIFVGLATDKSTMTTKSGFKVGDPEISVIRKFKSDPTYERYESRHGGAEWMHISLGKSSGPKSTVLRFTSRRGTITEIKAGHTEYVNNDDDYCAG